MIHFLPAGQKSVAAAAAVHDFIGARTAMNESSVKKVNYGLALRVMRRRQIERQKHAFCKPLNQIHWEDGIVVLQLKQTVSFVRYSETFNLDICIINCASIEIG